jgi:endogenous inhibitor of DNA gyrase (YacG/DUF329 family)
MKSSVCPICKGPRKAATDNSSYPFCGPRCKLADLSHWMDGRYAVDGDAMEQDDEGSGSGDRTVH